MKTLFATGFCLRLGLSLSVLVVGCGGGAIPGAIPLPTSLCAVLSEARPFYADRAFAELAQSARENGRETAATLLANGLSHDASTTDRAESRPPGYIGRPKRLSSTESLVFVLSDHLGTDGLMVF